MLHGLQLAATNIRRTNFRPRANDVVTEINEALHALEQPQPSGHDATTGGCAICRCPILESLMTFSTSYQRGAPHILSFDVWEQVLREATTGASQIGNAGFGRHSMM